LAGAGTGLGVGACRTAGGFAFGTTVDGAGSEVAGMTGGGAGFGVTFSAGGVTTTE